MPDPNDPFLIIDPRLGSLLVSAAGHLGATPSESQGAPLEFGPPVEAGEAGTLGHYRVVRELGRGGMGAVFLAVDTRLDRRLALKVMLPEFVANAEARERFLREARAAARISHDNVVTVFEADERDGVPYIAMQLLQGYPLDAFLQKKGTPSLRHSARIAREAALGLFAAHKLGVVHRDIKPANLWLESPQGRVKLLDFGLARPDGLDTELTRSGALIGTPAFMSPEQALGERVDHRTDLFSLGAVLYWLCTGRLPFPGANVVAVLKALVNEEPKPILGLNPRVPGPLAELIHQLLAKVPQGRPQTAAEVANRLHELLEQSPDLSTAGAGGGAEPVGAPSVASDPWTTLAKSANAQQARPVRVSNEPRVLRSMPVVAITPAAQPEEEQEDPAEPQKPAPGATRTVISSGILWEEVDEEAEEGKRPDRPKRRTKAEGERREFEAERPDRPTRRAAKSRVKGKNTNAMPFLIGVGAAALVAVSVVLTLLATEGRKATDSAQQGGGDRKEGGGVFNLWEPSKVPPASRPVTTPSVKPDGTPGVVPPTLPLIAGAVDPEPTVIGGGANPLFKDLPPEGGLLIGLELGLGRYLNDDVIQAGRPIYRVDGKEVFGLQRGTNLVRVVTLKAKEGYAVGAITCKYGLNFDGCSLTFMRVAVGKFDPRDSYESAWAGYDGPKRPVRLGGDGTPIVGLAGKATDRQLHGLGPLLKGQEAWDPRTKLASGPKYGVADVILGSKSGPAFRDDAPPGGLLVGFDVWCGTFSNYEVLDGVRPIYRTDGKDKFGALRGRETALVYRGLAKPGYAVGGLIMKAGLGPDSFVVVFMKVKGDRLDPNDSYQSERFGGPGGESHPMLGGDGTPVTGIIGRYEGKSTKLGGLGLVFPTKR